MGFFRSLWRLGGGQPSYVFDAALNALLAEHTLSKLSLAQIEHVFDNVPRILRAGAPNVSEHELQEVYLNSSRVVQLNCLALAMGHSEIRPAWRKAMWAGVTNPFAANSVTEEDLARVSAFILKTEGLDITLKQGPVNPFEYLGTAPSTTIASMVVMSCPECGQGLRIPAGKTLIVTCSACQKQFSRST